MATRFIPGRGWVQVAEKPKAKCSKCFGGRVLAPGHPNVSQFIDQRCDELGNYQRAVQVAKKDYPEAFRPCPTCLGTGHL